LDKDKKQRSATDVLLSMERNIELLLHQSRVADTNIKLILNHLNLLTRPPVKADIPQTLAPAHGPAKASVGVPEGPVIFPEARVEAPPQVEAPIELTPEILNRKSSVQQKIVYKDSRPVILAEVLVIDPVVQTNIIHKTRTDSHGKWHTELYSGKYIVKIKKGPTAMQPGFCKEYDIEILPGDKTTILERKQIL
jgi:hypothetical protein